MAAESPVRGTGVHRLCYDSDRPECHGATGIPQAKLSGLCALFDYLVGAPNHGVGDIEAFRQHSLIKSPLNACSGSERIVPRLGSPADILRRHRYVRFTREREHS